MMQLSGEDMSKSTGNVFTIEQFLGKYEADILRILILNASYRSPLTYNEDVIAQAAQALERLRGGLRPASPLADFDPELTKILSRAAEDARSGFETAMDDDFNSAGALGYLFELVKAINEARTAGVDQEALESAQDVLVEIAGVLGLTLAQQSHLDTDAAPFIDLLLEIRRELREAKQWELSDTIRDRLNELGVSLEDGKGGTVWRIR
jgi:cysteinyl-tRNA synthetase